MKIESLASHLNLPEQVVQEAGASLGLSPEKEISSADLKRLQATLESHHDIDPARFDALISAAPAPTPKLDEPVNNNSDPRKTEVNTDPLASTGFQQVS